MASDQPSEYIHSSRTCLCSVKCLKHSGFDEVELLADAIQVLASCRENTRLTIETAEMNGAKRWYMAWGDREKWQVSREWRRRVCWRHAGSALHNNSKPSASSRSLLAHRQAEARRPVISHSTSTSKTPDGARISLSWDLADLRGNPAHSWKFTNPPFSSLATSTAT